MFTWRPPRTEILLLALASLCHAGEMRTAPRADAAPVNQLSLSGNVCGPAALLASFRCGSESWQRAAASLPGATDREQLRHWLRHYGHQPSTTLKGRKRWTTAGINAEDLVAAANEMTRPLFLPQVSQEGLFLRRGEDPAALLRRTHQRLDASLKKGIPPLLSLRRHVHRGGHWVPVQAHFVTVIALPAKLAKGQSELPITYLDPWGGKRCQGILRVPTRSLLALEGRISPCLEAVVPTANIGKSQVRKGEASAVIPAAIIGRW